VIQFLNTEYEKEKKEYPLLAPDFDADAAFWAAKTVYISAQLLLYRANKETDLPQLLPDFGQEQTAEAILSADLCLRFLPDIITHLQLIDPEDALLPLLQKIIHQWHYSGIAGELSTEHLDFEPVMHNPCLWHLYIDRVIAYQKKNLANLPILRDKIKASLGIYAKELLNLPNFIS
jgi:hypothetical protein